MKSDLNKAIQIACLAHDNQTDKAGKDYILHPLRLMLKFNKIEEQLVAVLHDVVEDSAITLNELKDYGFSSLVVGAVDCLTKRSGDEYSLYLERIFNNDLARKIKIEDIKDNLDLSRLKTIEHKDLERIKKYHEALRFLESKI